MSPSLSANELVEKQVCEADSPAGKRESQVMD
jgi:hypothetical protein